MKFRSFFVVALMASVVLSTPALPQSDTTTTILQGLQNLNGVKPAAPSAQTGAAGGFDQLKAAAIARASMSAIDTDRNGTVSKPELAALTNQFFDVADTNRDGQLSEGELSTFAANMNKVMMFLR